MKKAIEILQDRIIYLTSQITLIEKEELTMQKPIFACEKEIKKLKKAQSALSKINISLQDDAKECLTALSYWDENEFKYALSPHRKLKGMRPMILTKKLLEAISNIN